MRDKFKFICVEGNVVKFLFKEFASEVTIPYVIMLCNFGLHGRSNLSHGKVGSCSK